MEKAYAAYADLDGRGVKIGVGPLRGEYIDAHLKLAEVEMINLAIYQIKIHARSMVNDGWGDGMKLLQLIAEEPNGKLVKIRWHDGNKEFFIQCKSGGWAPYKYQAVSK